MEKEHAILSPSSLESDDAAAMTHEVPAENGRGWEREVAAFGRLLPGLLSSIPGMYVAVHDGQVVDRDGDDFELAKRIGLKYGAEFVLIRRVSDEEEGICYLDSPEVAGE